MHKKKLLFTLVMFALVASKFAIATTPNSKSSAVKDAAANVNKLVIKDADVKVGYFNSAIAIRDSKYGKDLLQEVEQKRQQYTTALKRAEQEYAKRVKEYQDKASMISVAARENEEKELLRMKRDFENQARAYEEDLKIDMRQKQERISVKLSDAVYISGRTANKDLMVDVLTGRQYPINNDKIDMTTSIVVGLDKDYDKELASAKGKSSSATRVAKSDAAAGKSTA